MATGVEGTLIDLLGVFIIAAAVSIAVTKLGGFPYTIALLIAGFGVSVLGIDFGIVLSHDIIILLLLPPLLFEGAATTDLEAFKENLVPILLLAVPGLLLSVAFLGVVTHFVLGIPILVSLLFAITILPTDPVSVLALFDDLGAPERLSVLVEGESLINDGVGVVVFGALLTLVENQATIQQLLQLKEFGELGFGIVVSVAGGALVGVAVGYLVYGVMVGLNEERTELVLTIILAYGSFLLAEHFIGVSGVVATVAAGLLIGNRGAEYAMSSQTRISIFRTWETGAYIVNTYIFIAIGATTPISQLLDNSLFILVAIVLVLVARALSVYPFAFVANRLTTNKVSFAEQHVMLWGGLHASIPIALALGIPETLPNGSPFPFREEILAMVFGVAGFSLVVQGLSMGRVLDYLGIITKSDEEEMYELLLGRARIVEEALNAAERLNSRGELTDGVYQNFKDEYTAEKDELEDAISRLLNRYPYLRERQKQMGERQVLKEEKAALMSSTRRGLISEKTSEKLVEEINLKIEKVNRGETTIASGEEQEYEEFWRQEAEEFGLFDEEENEG